MTPTPRRSGVRSATVLLAGLALAGGLAGCGGDGTDTAEDPAPTASPSTSTTETTPEPPEESTTPPPDSGGGGRESVPATGSAGVTDAVVVGATEGGGSPSTLAFALDTDQAVADFAAQFEAGFGQLLTDTAAEVTEPGATTYGATAAVGCEAPTSVAIEAGEAGFEVTPELPKSTVQCLAPVTYVVLFAVPDA